MRIPLVSVTQRLALAVLVTAAALAGPRAVADPARGAAPPGNAEKPTPGQPAGESSALTIHPIATPPASRTQAKSPLLRHGHRPPSSAHRPPPARQHVSAADPQKPRISHPPSAPVHGTHREVVPPQPAQKAPSPQPPTAHPSDDHAPERIPPQPQAIDPDARDAGPHADRTSRDRAER